VNKSNRLLSEIVSFRTYAKYLPHIGRRETLEETINRNMTMHLERFPKLSRDILKAYKQVHDLKTMPSMRSLQFGGEPIVKNNVRMFNCGFTTITQPRKFAEALYVLLCGTGLGYSVQKHHVKQLPSVRKPKEEGTYVIHDSIEGWAEAVNALCQGYFYGGVRPLFDYSMIRPKGSILVSLGAKAPGSDPLRVLLTKLEEKFIKAVGRKLTSLEVHDMICIIADGVLSGGIRRAALISLFDKDDEDMLKCKHGNWWEKHPYRARANNSAVLLRQTTTKDEFRSVYERCIESNAGEPGFFWTSDESLSMGANPCKPLRSTVLTNEGYITFEEALKKDSLKVYTPDGRLVSATKPFKTGENREVFKITLSNGLYLYGTDNHLHQTQDGRWKRVDELEVGERLAYRVEQRIPTTIDNNEEYEHGLLMGWLYGDGWNYKRSDSVGSKRAGLCFGVNEMDVVSFFEGMLDKRHIDHFQKPETCKIIRVDQTHLKGLDKTEDLGWLRTKSPEFKLGFIKAIFTADGSVRRNNNVELYSIKRDWIETICLVLQEFGIRSTVTVHANAKSYVSSDGKQRNNSTTYKLNVHSGQFKRIGFISKLKQDLVEQQQDNGLFRRVDYETVIDIELDSVEDVYDITVNDVSHAFLDVGVVTHNCVEISLNPNQMCNLTTTNLTGIKSEKDFHNRVYASALLGTLQASYTDFPYLSEDWRNITEKEALLGCSFTGIADARSNITAKELQAVAKLVLEVNNKYARKIGINPTARACAIKPEGSASCVLGSSSGIHARYSEHYLRRVRMNKDDALAKYLQSVIPDLVEDDLFSNTGVVVTIPQESPANSIVQESETALQLFNRVLFFNRNWVAQGHVSGTNKHNVSTTINYKEEDIEPLFDALWDNRSLYTGVSLLPYDGGTYQQAPFEKCTKSKFEELDLLVKDVDLTKVIELQDNTERLEQLACSGGLCELT
jgi:hypothetical protein